MMERRTASRTIYYLVRSDDFAELVREYQVARMDPNVLIFRGVYLGQEEIDVASFEKAKLSLSHHPAHTLLRPVPSSDGSPSWSAIVYRNAGSTTINLRAEHRIVVPIMKKIPNKLFAITLTLLATPTHGKMT
jgi:hypothetical protein